MKTKYKLFFNLMVILGICFSLFGLTIPVKAATCIWNGLLNIDWNIPTNWSDCNNSIPTASDDVIIPEDVPNDPTIPRNFDLPAPNANSITIQTGAKLTIMGNMAVYSPHWYNYGTLEASMVPDYDVIYIMGVLGSNNLGEFINHEGGTVNVVGSGGDRNLFMYLPFTNNGLVDLQSANIILNRGGTHAGTFQGNAGTRLYIGLDMTNQTYTFETTSFVKVPYFYIREGTVNFNGTYWPTATGSILNLQAVSASGCTLNFTPDSTIAIMAEMTNVDTLGKINFQSSTAVNNLNRLYLYSGGEINNLGEITISDSFYWNGGTLSGSGSTEVLSIASTFTIKTTTHYLDEQSLTNSTTANWDAGNITLSNAASFQNDNTFNANGTTTLSGASNGAFDNNGSFYKKTPGTTTSVDIDFTNLGTVEVIAGTLTFESGLTSGAGTTVNLGEGSLTAGDTLTLEEGASLVGSGTLNSNLINGGEVSPGSSPGLINIGGDYTQTADGILTIELGGTTAGTEHDQVVITGNAILAGTLDVNLYADFTPSVGDSFTIMSYASHTGVFTSVNLPPLPVGLEWEIEYGSNAIILTALEATSFNIFLPLIIR